MEMSKSESEEVKFDKQIDRLLKNPLIVTKRSQSRLSEEDISNKHLSKTKKLPSKKSVNEKSPEVKDQEMLSESDSESTAELPRPTESPSLTIPDRNETVRRALLISSDSENDFDNSDSLTPESEPKKQSGSDKEDVVMEENNVADRIQSETVATGSEVEEDLSKSTSPETRKLLSLSVPDPATESDDSKSTKGSKEEKKKRERKKRRINSDSDFESSDSDKKKKKSKKKRRINASGTEELSDDDDSSTESKAKPKPRRRIKKVAVSGSEDSDDSDVKVLNESQRSDPGGSKGRKNIKKIMKDNSLKVLCFRNFLFCYSVNVTLFVN